MRRYHNYSTTYIALAGFFAGFVIHYTLQKIYSKPQQVDNLKKTNIVTNKALLWTIISSIIKSLSELIIIKTNEMAGIRG